MEISRAMSTSQGTESKALTMSMKTVGKECEVGERRVDVVDKEKKVIAGVEAGAEASLGRGEVIDGDQMFH